MRCASSGSMRGAVAGELDWDGIRVTRVPARHGSGALAEALAPVSGFVLDDLYLAGDTVWYEGVAETIAAHRPRVAVVNAGGARVREGGLISDGQWTTCARSPRACRPSCAVHMEAINHCAPHARCAACGGPGVLVPEDGETLEL